MNKLFIFGLLAMVTLTQSHLLAEEVKNSSDQLVYFDSNDLEVHSYVLYTKNYCPYCQKVLNFMEKNGIKVIVKDLMSSDDFVVELKELSGKTRVPVLRINEEDLLYESDDIIIYLENNKEIISAIYGI